MDQPGASPPGATPASDPAPAAPATGSSTNPLPPRPSPVRGRLKMVGIAMVLVGGFLGFTFGSLAHVGPMPQTWSQFPGGTLNVVVPPASEVALLYHGYANDTTHLVDAEGRASLKLERAYVTIRATWGDGSAQQEAVVPSGDTLNLTLTTSSEELAGIDIGQIRIYWIHASAYVLAMIGGVLAFRAVGPRLAMATAILALTVTLHLALNSLTLPFLAALFAFALAIWLIHKGRNEFRPLRIGSVNL